MNEKVLIADSHGERGRRVARACAAYGIDVHLVTHGAAALEYALGQKPMAMVAQLELPLIEGARLAEILHHNPHTRGMAVLFVGDGPADARAKAAAQVIPGHADPDTIARFIEALLQKRRPGPRGESPIEAEPGVAGQLAQISLGELLELFHVNRKTGVVELKQGDGRRAQIGRVHLLEGNVIQARTGSVEGEKALFRLLAWRRGSFSFREDAPVERVVIDRPTRALLRLAERQAREWERLASEMPPVHARVSLRVPRESLPSTLHPLTREVLGVLEHSDRVQDVLDRCRFPDYPVLRSLQTLVRREIVALRTDAAPSDSGPLAPTQIARLREWIESGRPRDGVLPDAKIAVFAATGEAQRELAALLARFPGAEHTPGGDRVGVWSTLRVPLDGDVSLEWFEVPASPRFAPIWSLAAHGALATVFVHAGSLDASVSALGEAIRVVGEGPRSRCFHLRLDLKGRSDADALCERLGVFDDRRILSLSLDPPEAAVAALRDVLAQLMP